MLFRCREKKQITIKISPYDEFIVDLVDIYDYAK